MWFSESVIGILSAWLDIGVGIFGGIYGTLAGIFLPKRKFKTLILSLNIFAVIAGMVLIGVGLYALLSDKPYHIWFLFVRIGAILVVIFTPLFFVLRNIRRESELNKMVIKDID